jgi:hypothetical protein
MEIMPQTKIVDIQKMKERTGAFLKGVWNAGRVTELCLSEHKRGASEMLDRVMDKGESQFETPLELDCPEGGRWSDMGRY